MLDDIIKSDRSINIFCSPKTGSSALIHHLAKQKTNFVNLDEYFNEYFPSDVEYNPNHRYITKITNGTSIPDWFDTHDSVNVNLYRENRFHQTVSWYLHRKYNNELDLIEVKKIDERLFLECHDYIKKVAIFRSDVRFDYTITTEQLRPLIPNTLNFVTPLANREKTYDLFARLWSKY